MKEYKIFEVNQMNDAIHQAIQKFMRSRKEMIEQRVSFLVEKGLPIEKLEMHEHRFKEGEMYQTRFTIRCIVDEFTLSYGLGLFDTDDENEKDKS